MTNLPVQPLNNFGQADSHKEVWDFVLRKFKTRMAVAEHKEHVLEQRVKQMAEKINYVIILEKISKS